MRPGSRSGPGSGSALYTEAARQYRTAKTSLESGAGDFVGLQNYQRQLGDFPTGGAWIAIRNNVYWLILYTLVALGFGLLLAVLFDRVRYETFVKSLIFMPMAISAVALGVIWRFMYWYQPPGVPQTGTVNAILGIFHQDPRIWVQDPSVDNFAIIAAATWGITGFAMVILSAALKGIPADLLEAARVDGAGEITIFRRVIFPLMMPTVVVVGTTLVIFANQVRSCMSSNSSAVAKYFTEFGGAFPNGLNKRATTSTGTSWG